MLPPRGCLASGGLTAFKWRLLQPILKQAREKIIGKGNMKVIYYGHACFGVQIANRNLLFDPFITGNELAKGVDVGKIPADYILISHAHSDHIEDAAKIAHRTGATLI